MDFSKISLAIFLAIAAVISAFSPFAFAEASLAPPCGNYGDIDKDGLVTKEDLNITSEAWSGRQALSSDQLSRADVNGNGTLDSNDVLQISEYIDGALSTFTACQTIKCFKDSDCGVSACKKLESADTTADGGLPSLPSSKTGLPPNPPSDKTPPVAAILGIKQ